MQQKAVVMETFGDKAKVQVLRSSMCEGCEKRGSGTSCACGELLGANREMTALAHNKLGAKAGDSVIIETSSATVLGYAALVFLFPILAFFVGYTIGGEFFQTQAFGWIFGSSFFAVSFVLILFLEKIKQKKPPQISITEIISREKDERKENET